jgi:hypothetical protein
MYVQHTGRVVHLLWPRTCTQNTLVAKIEAALVLLHKSMMEFSPKKKKGSPIVGEIKHELGMFNKINNNEEMSSSEKGDLFVSGMTLDTYMSNVVMKGPIPEVCGIGNSSGMQFTPPKKQKDPVNNILSNTKKNKIENNANNHEQSSPYFVEGMSLETYMVQGTRKRGKQPNPINPHHVNNKSSPEGKLEIEKGEQQVIKIAISDDSNKIPVDVSSSSSDEFVADCHDEEKYSINSNNTTSKKIAEDVPSFNKNANIIIENEEFDAKLRAEREEEDKSVAGMRLDTYMEERVKYNTDLEISKPDLTISMTLTPQSERSDHKRVQSANVDVESVMAHASETSHDKIESRGQDNLNLSSSALTTASNWSTNTQSMVSHTVASRASTVEVQFMQASFKTSKKKAPNYKHDNYNSSNDRIDNSIILTNSRGGDSPLLLLEDSNDNVGHNNTSTYTATRKIEPFVADEFNAKPDLLIKLESFLNNELDKVEGKSFKRMCQQHRHGTPQKKGAPPILKKGELPLLTTNARLQAYRQAFHIYMSDSRQRKYHTFLTNVAKEYNNALERAEMCIQSVPEMKSQIGSAKETMEQKIHRLKENSSRIIEKLNSSIQKERLSYQLNLKRKDAEIFDLKSKLEAVKKEKDILSSQRNQLVNAQSTLLGFFKKWAQWRADGKVDANYIRPDAAADDPKDPSTNIDEDSVDEDEDIPEETAEQKAFRIQQKLSRQEWKGVHETLTTITKTHTKALSDIEELSKLHSTQMKNAKDTIKELVDKLEFATMQGVNFNQLDFHKNTNITNDANINNNKHNNSDKQKKIIDKRLKPRVEKRVTKTDGILEQILSRRPFPIEVIRMEEKKEQLEKERKIRNIKRSIKGLGTSPIRTKKMNATRPGKKASSLVRESPLARRTKRDIKNEVKLQKRRKNVRV